MPTQVEAALVLGNMDLNSDITRIKKPDYRQALNIRFSSHDSGKSWLPENVEGNTFAFEIPNIGVQNVRFKITEVLGAAGYFIYLRDQQGNIIAQNDAAKINFATMITNFDAALVTAGFVNGVTYIKTLDPTGSGANSYFYEFSQIPSYPYILLSTIGAIIEVIQDAIDYSINTMGLPVPIGGVEILGNLFILSSVQKEMPATLAVTLKASNGAGSPLWRITVGLHGFDLGQQFMVTISGVTGLTDGRYMVLPGTTTSFDIQGLAWPGGGSVVVAGRADIFTDGFLEIGVVREINAAVPYAYNPLIQSRLLNGRIQRQINCVAEPTADSKYAIYWVDGFNDDKVAYFEESQLGVYLGGLDLRGGDYDLATIDQEMLLQSSASAVISFVSQNLPGGSLKVGNYRYTASFLTLSGTETKCIIPTNDILVSGGTIGSANLTIGDDGSVVTSASNVLLINGFDPGIYQFIILYAARNVDGAIEVTRVGQYLLDPSQTTITITHTGNENGATIVSTGELKFYESIFKVSKDIDVISRRLCLFNISGGNIEDYSAFCKTIQHKIMKYAINVLLIGGTYNEFQTPNNVCNHLGLMRNEVYQWACLIELMNGYIIPYAFYLDTIVIDTAALVNAANPETPSRRIAGGTYTTYDLTDNAVPATQIYVPYVEFTIPNVDFPINGRPAKDLIKKLHYVRAECIPEILRDGIFIGLEGPTSVGGFDHYMEDLLSLAYSSGNNKFGSFYSADTVFVSNPIGPKVAGDQLISFGIPNLSYAAANYTPTISASFIYVAGHNGLTTDGAGGTTQPQIQNVTDVIYAGSGTKTFWQSENFFVDKADIGNSSVIYASNFISVANDLLPLTTNTHFAMWAVQYKRALVDKYKPLENIIYYPTAAFADFSTLGTATTIATPVFEGDTFVGAFNFKIKNIPTAVVGFDPPVGIRFYHQCRVNPNLRGRAFKNPDQLLFPFNITLDNWLKNVQPEEFKYNKGFTIFQQPPIDPYAAFNPNVPTIVNYPTGITWSNPQAEGTLIDEKRTFPPLNLKIEEMSNGEIVWGGSLNGEMVILQKNAFRREYFNSNNQLTTADDTLVQLGSGEVMRANSALLSLFGCQNFFSPVKAYTKEGGTETLWWKNVDKRVLCRFGYDGTVTLSVANNMDSWFQNNFFNFPFVPGQTPAFDGDGIRGLHNRRHNEIHFSVGFGPKPKRKWRQSPYITSKQGDCVSYNGVNYVFLGVYYWDDIFNQSPGNKTVRSEMIGQDLATPGTTPATVGTSVWATFTPKTGFTLVFDMSKHGFSCFFSPQPNLYLSFKNTYFTPGQNASNRINLNNEGNICSWDDDTIQVDGYIEYVENDLPSEFKKFIAWFSEADLPPFRVEARTDQNVTYLDAAEWNSNNKEHRAPVKEDSTVTAGNPSGLNNLRTGGIFGTWMIARVYFQKLVKQKIVSFVTKFNVPMQRTFKK